MDTTAIAGVGALLLLLTICFAFLLAVLAVTNAALMATALLLASLLRAARRAFSGRWPQAGGA